MIKRKEDRQACFSKAIRAFFDRVDGGKSFVSLSEAVIRSMGAIHSLALKGSTVYAACYKGLYRSRDGGSVWEPLPISAGSTLYARELYTIAADASTLVAGGWDDVWISTDAGKTWIKNAVTQGLSSNRVKVRIQRHPCNHLYCILMSRL